MARPCKWSLEAREMRPPALGRKAPPEKGRRSATSLPLDLDGMLLVAEDRKIEEDGHEGKKEKVRERAARPLCYHRRALHHCSALLLARQLLRSSSAAAARCSLVLSDGALCCGSVVQRLREVATWVKVELAHRRVTEEGVVVARPPRWWKVEEGSCRQGRWWRSQWDRRRRNPCCCRHSTRAVGH